MIDAREYFIEKLLDGGFTGLKNNERNCACTIKELRYNDCSQYADAFCGCELVDESIDREDEEETIFCNDNGIERPCVMGWSDLPDEDEDEEDNDDC